MSVHQYIEVEAIVEESSEEKLQGVILSKKLNFKSKVRALARVSTLMDLGRLLLLREQLHKCAV